MEWDSGKAVRQGQEKDSNQSRSNGYIADSNDLYEDSSLEPMDIDSW